MIITLLGAEINNGNLGCQALTWSILQLLNDIAKKRQLKIIYYIIEAEPSEEKKKKLCSKLLIPSKNINIIKRGSLVDPLRCIKHFNNNINCFKIIKKSDIFINLTQGDSFSDLYGIKVFHMFSKFITFAIKNNIPVIMGPQTYGPFESKKAIKEAAYIFNNSEYIFSRDLKSAEFVYSIADVNVTTVCDLAFNLKYKKQNVKKTSKMKIGINISGLLADNKVNQYNHKLNSYKKYNKLINELLYILCNNNKVEVHLIPHVNGDVVFINKYHNLYPDTCIYELFDDPIEAKNLISTMDIFIGSRMHATIAAVSSGVFTIPIAYSRKFEGVFDLLEYKNTINLYEISAEKACKIIMEHINNLEVRNNEIKSSLDICKKYNNLLKDKFEEVLVKYYK